MSGVVSDWDVDVMLEVLVVADGELVVDVPVVFVGTESLGYIFGFLGGAYCSSL